MSCEVMGSTNYIERRSISLVMGWVEVKVVQILTCNTQKSVQYSVDLTKGKKEREKKKTRLEQETCFD